MRKYTGLTQLESGCHLKMSSIFHCLGLYNDPSDINFVHVHQNAIRNAYNTSLLTGLHSVSNWRLAVKESPVVHKWFLPVTHMKEFGYGKGILGKLEGDLRIFTLISLVNPLQFHYKQQVLKDCWKYAANTVFTWNLLSYFCFALFSLKYIKQVMFLKSE